MTWVATSSSDGAAHLVPLSIGWTGEAIVIVTEQRSPTSRHNLTHTEHGAGRTRRHEERRDDRRTGRERVARVGRRATPGHLRGAVGLGPAWRLRRRRLPGHRACGRCGSRPGGKRTRSQAAHSSATAPGSTSSTRPSGRRTRPAEIGNRSALPRRTARLDVGEGVVGPVRYRRTQGLRDEAVPGGGGPHRTR